MARAARDFFKDLGASGPQNPKFSRARRGTRAQACGWGVSLAPGGAPGGPDSLMPSFLNGGSKVYCSEQRRVTCDVARPHHPSLWRRAVASAEQLLAHLALRLKGDRPSLIDGAQNVVQALCLLDIAHQGCAAAAVLPVSVSISSPSTPASASGPAS